VQVVYDSGRAAIEAGAVGSVAATAQTVSLAALAGRRNFLCSAWIDGLGATSGSVIQVTITGLVCGTITRQVTIPAGVTVALASPLIISFDTPIAASGVNSAISLIVPSFGSGNTVALVGIHGFSL
jgi:hypothetical protein